MNEKENMTENDGQRERVALIFSVYRWWNKTEEQASRAAQTERRDQRVN